MNYQQLSALQAAVPTAPARQFCGFMLDSARCLEGRSYYRKFIDFAAARGMNLLLWHFTDDQGCSLQFDSIPDAASPNAYSKAEMRELIQYAGDQGIEIVPELASLGHSRYLTRLPEYRHLNETEHHFTGMCPVSDETRQIIRRLIEETAEVFPSRHFHVGLDEVNIGEHPLTKAALQTQTHAELLTDYANFVHGVVSSTGRRMWMWGDALLKHPTMLQGIPRDILICNWQYAPNASVDTTHTLLDAGFDVLLCSALISHDQTLFPGEQFAMPNIRALQRQRSLADRSDEPGRGSLVGHLSTIWTPVRFIADSLWVGVDLAASILREGPRVEAEARTREFAQTFHGLSGKSVSSFAEVVGLLIEFAPTRKEWLAVAKLEPLSAVFQDRVMMLAPKWAHACAILSKIAPAVSQHVAEYRAFMLLIQLLAHAYDAADQLSDTAATATSLARLARRGRAIIDRLEKNWDQARFANDPRKYLAPIASFQSDHLIPLIGCGLAVIEARLEKTRPEVEITHMINPRTATAAGAGTKAKKPAPDAA